MPRFFIIFLFLGKIKNHVRFLDKLKGKNIEKQNFKLLNQLKNLLPLKEILLELEDYLYLVKIQEMKKKKN